MKEKLLYVHDHKFIQKEDGLYSTGGLTIEIIEILKKLYGNISICSRLKDEETINVQKVFNQLHKHYVLPDLKNK